MHNRTLTAVPGIRVGHATHRQAQTGCTVVLCEEGMTAGVDVRGSAPGTREIAALHPLSLVQDVHAVLLTGGSAFGLDAAAGVMRYLEERGKGYPVGGNLRVPIVPAAVLFDLHVGEAQVRPDAAMAYQACQNATEAPVEEGAVGAGTGARVGPDRSAPGGVGSTAVHLPDGLIVAALVVVNAFGNVVDPATGEVVAGSPERRAFSLERSPLGQTTLGVVATNAALPRVGLTKIAQMAHDGLARVIYPVHTMFDGDTIFALAKGNKPADINQVGSLAADMIAQAVLRAVKFATGPASAEEGAHAKE